MTCTSCHVQVTREALDTRARRTAPAPKRRSSDNLTGSPTVDTHPMQRAAKRRRANAADSAGVDQVATDDMEADFKVLPTAVQITNCAQRAKRRAEVAGGLQVCLLLPLNRSQIWRPPHP